MLDIISCKFCNKPFQSFGGKICNNCLEQIERDFKTIREYIYDNPDKSSIDEICKETEVDRAIVLHLLREKRLTIQNLADGALTCDVCHKPIRSGTMCDSCKKALANKLVDTLPKRPAEEDKKPLLSTKDSKMHVQHGKIRRDK